MPSRDALPSLLRSFAAANQQATGARDQLFLSVQDTGIGIRQEDLPRLFREFEQIEPAAGVKPQGTGLGLALTKRLIELHGGEIRVSSEFGRGSTFTVILPARRESAVNSLPEGDTGPSESLVLVVEDDPKAADLIASHLRTAGMAVAFATGERALAVASALQPKAITLDLLMPGIDGWTVLDQLKSSPPTKAIPIVVISVVDEADRGLLLGATDYLVKPVSQDAIFSSLQAVGVPLRRVTGVRVLVAGTGNGDLDSIEAHLKTAGCEVRRASALTSQVLAEMQPDVALVDLWSDPAGAVENVGNAIEDAQARSIPVLAILGAGQTSHPDWRTLVENLPRTDALRADRLVRAVRQALDWGRYGASLWHPLTGLPSEAALLMHLRSAIERADREHQRIVIAIVRVSLPTEQGSRIWSQLVRARLRPTEFLASVDDDVLSLVAYGLAPEGVESLKARFMAVLEESSAAPTEIQFVSYPDDATRAEDLVRKVLSVGRKGNSR